MKIIFHQIARVGVVLAALSSLTDAQALKVSVADGGSVITPLGYNVKVNKNSTLRRTWVTVNDPSCAVQLVGPGITTAYESDRVSGTYNFKSAGSVLASEAVSALQITFVLYDPFGAHLETLAAEYVEDLATGSTTSLGSLGGTWYATENDVRRLLTVVTFVSSIRTAGGAVWKADSKAISAELSKIHLQVTGGVLEPEKPSKK